MALRYGSLNLLKVQYINEQFNLLVISSAFSCGGFRLLQVVHQCGREHLRSGARGFLFALIAGRSLAGDHQRWRRRRRWRGRPSSLRPVEFGLANPREGGVAWRLVGLVTTMVASTKPGAATAGLATNPAPEGAGIECCIMLLATPRLASVVF